LYAHDLNDADTSTYHLSALKFIQAANGTISAQEIQTDLISEVGQTLRTVDDLFGDGMTDLVTPIGCTRNPAILNNQGGGTSTYPGCLLMDDAAYGVASINLYPSLTTDVSAPVATSTFTSAYKTYINQNYGAKSTPSLLLAQTKAAAQKGLKVADDPAPALPTLPDLLALTTNGVGAVSAWAYAPLSLPANRDGILFYDLPGNDGYTDDRHFYFTSSMPVVSGFVQSNGVGDFVGFRSAIYGYGQAMYNHYGRGFQGFRTITSETAVDNTVATEWDRRVRTTTTFHQKFPLTGQVESVLVSKQNTTNLISSQTPSWRCATRTTTNYLAPLSRASAALCPGDTGSSATVAANTVYFPFLDSETVKSFDPGTGLQIAQSDTDNALTATNSAWDENGNLGNQVVTVKDIGTPDLDSHVTTTTQTFSAAPATWWLDKLTQSKVVRTIAYNATNHDLPGGALSAPSQTVTTDYTWNIDHTPSTRRIQETVPDQASVTSYTYPATSYGLPSQVAVTQTGLDPALSPTRTTSFTYTKNGTSVATDGYFVLDTTLDPSGLNQKTTTTWDKRDGQILTSTDANLVKTSVTYDRFGRAIQLDTTDKNGVAIGYPVQSAWTTCLSGGCAGGVGEDTYETHAAWRVITVHPGFPVQATWFDVLGRPIKQGSGSFDGTVVSTLTLYDRLGTVANASTPYKPGDAPALSTTTYDLLNRPIKKVLLGASLDSSNGNELREYSYSGRTTTVTVHAASKVLVGVNCPGSSLNLCFKVTRRANALGQLMNTTDAGGSSTNFWPGANGPLVAMKDTEGNLTTATVDALGRRTLSADPDQGTSSYAYDALGELRTQTDARNVLTSVTGRDALGRMTARTITPNSAATGLSPLAYLDTWTYDPANAKGQLDTATRKRGIPTGTNTVWQESTAYDVASRPITLSTVIAEGSPVTLNYGQTYDDSGRPQTVTYPSSLKVQTGYTTYGQTRSLSNADTQSTYWTALSADAWGHIKEETANGVDGSYGYDGDTGQSLTRTWTKSGVAVTSLIYTYDSFANLTQQTRDGHNEIYAYDARQRLMKTTRSSGDVNYGYTTSGNITKKSDYSTDVAGAYTYAAANARTAGCGPHAANGVSLSGGGSVTFTCDANGNVIGGSTLTAMYSADDHPTQIQRTGVGGIPDPSCATAVADRVFCSGFQAYTAGVGGGTANWSYASDGSKVYESSSQGTVLFGHYGYERFGSVHRHQLGSVVVSRNGGTDTVTAVLGDRLGSTVATVDSVTNLRAFDAFGAVRNGDLSNKPDGKLALPSTIHGFTQHEQVDDVRLIHMGGRVFDPALGRFLNVDPVVQNAANSQALNPYSYILNNPLSGTDPSGYQAVVDSCTPATGTHVCGASTAAGDSTISGHETTTDPTTGKTTTTTFSGVLNGNRLTSVAVTAIGNGASPGLGPHSRTPTQQETSSLGNPVVQSPQVTGQGADAVSTQVSTAGTSDSPSRRTYAFAGAGDKDQSDNEEFYSIAKEKFQADYIYPEKAFGGHGNAKTAFEDAKAFISSHKNAEIYIVGYSAGGDDAIVLANLLGKTHIPVTGMVTFDPHKKNLSGYSSYKLEGSNVARALNIYQRNEHDISYNTFRGSPVLGAQNIDMTGQEVGHSSIVSEGYAQYGKQINSVMGN
jgi:RHS repeat-associated protein